MAARSRKFVSDYPHLVEEWHTEKNHPNKPDEFKHKSNKVVWWQCPLVAEHHYKTSITNRTRKSPSGCPFCSGNKVDDTNSVSGVNPELVDLWDFDANGELTPDAVHHGSTKVCFWKCDQADDHKWPASPKQLSKTKNKCPFCDERKVCSSNSLAVTRPDLAEQWYGDLNGSLTPSEVTRKSKDDVWWYCKEEDDHIWQEPVSKRVRRHRCPFCIGKMVCRSNSLATCHPEIAAQWDYEKNHPLTPSQVTRGSNSVVHWICDFNPGHKWPARINSRTTPSQRNGCPHCDKRQQSGPELRLLSELESIFDDVKYRHRIEGLELDIFLPELNIGIEYDGAYFHKNKFKKDSEKNLAFQQLGVLIFRLRRAPLSAISQRDVIVHSDDLVKADIDKCLEKVLLSRDTKTSKEILVYLRERGFRNDEQFLQYLSDFPKPQKESSLAFTHPDVAREWDYDRNDPLTPEDFTFGSDYKAHWICGRDDTHVWEASVSHRTNPNFPTNCPHCFGKGPHTSLKKANSYQINFPEAAAEWSKKANQGVELEGLTKSSTCLATFVCSFCDKPFERRVKKHRRPGCRDCRKKITARNNRLSQEEVIKQFKQVHGDLYDYSSVVYEGDRDYVTIKCNKHGPFPQTPNAHKRGQGCPDCGDQKKGQYQSLEKLRS